MSENLTSILSIANNPNTYVNGILKWKDDKDRQHPLQFCKIQLWDKEPLNDKMLLETYTDKDGRYSFSFKNSDEASDFENGGYDIYVRVLPAGSDITVLRGNGTEYYVDLGYYENIPTGSIESISATFEMTDSEDNANMFARALQVSQAAIFASKYYEEMKEYDVEDVTLIYPHNEQSSGSFYRNSNKTIYVTGSAPEPGMPESYASWNVIMHEYGHHVSNMEGLTDSPGGGHYIESSIAEHYKKHFEGTVNLLCGEKCALYNNLNYFSEDECKYKGMALAWSEGYATFFGIIAQEYFSTNLAGIDFTNDKSYTSYNGVDYSVENILGGTEDNESVILGILYDIYDDSTESYDTLSIDHKQI